MKDLNCTYCDVSWDEAVVKATYEEQVSNDMLHCPECEKPNFVILNDDEKKIIKRTILKRRMKKFLKSIIWLPVLAIILLVVFPDFRDVKILLFVLFFAFLHFPFVRPNNSKTERKALMWKYGTLAKSTYRD